MEVKTVDKKYLLKQIASLLAYLDQEILKSKPRWCPATIYLWWVQVEVGIKEWFEDGYSIY